MSVERPFHRTFRAMKPHSNAGYSGRAFVLDKGYAKSPGHYVRAYLLIQEDLIKLFEYIEPSDEGRKAYSFRIHELLMRACIEVEPNFKAILSENIYKPKLDRFNNPIYNMTVYRKIEKSHRLSNYSLTLPIWNGKRRVFKPFSAWARGSTPTWYQAYNASKHDRQEAFKHANLDNLLSAVAGLLVVISAQFGTEDFTAGPGLVTYGGEDFHEMEPAIGSLFRIQFPTKWKSTEVYDFDWSVLSKDPYRFDKIDFNVL